MSHDVSTTPLRYSLSLYVQCNNSARTACRTSWSETAALVAQCFV